MFQKSSTDFVQNLDVFKNSDEFRTQQRE